MRWAIAFAVLGAVSTVVVFVIAVAKTRDPIPDKMRTCVQAGRAQVVRSEGDLGSQVRGDVGAMAIREISRTRVGDDTAVLLQGTGYQLLVLAGRKSPPLDGDLPLRVFRTAQNYALVAREVAPSTDVLRDCIALAREG